jgi:hypothetical protein
MSPNMTGVQVRYPCNQMWLFFLLLPFPLNWLLDLPAHVIPSYLIIVVYITSTLVHSTAAAPVNRGEPFSGWL